MHSIRAISDGARVLELDALTVQYPGASRPVVDRLSLSLGRGECLGVVGESGAGKSQAFLAAMGLTPATARVSGSVRVLGEELANAARRRLERVRGARVAMIFQNPMSSLTPHMRIGDQIAEVIARHEGASWRSGRRRALALLRDVHLSEPEQRLRQFPHELSGGMRQRVMIAMALACGPSVLIADEPTTALDVTVQAQILALLAELKRARGMAIVLISHDLGVVAGLADRVAVMQAGRIVEQESVSRLFAAPAHPHTQALLRAVAHLEPIVAAPGAARQEPAAANGSTTDRDGTEPEPAVLLEVSHLRVRYRVPASATRSAAVIQALDDVSLRLDAGETLGIVGESGCGKTTLVRAVLALLRPLSGEVIWMGQPLARLSAAELRPLRPKLQLIFQDPLASLDPRMTAQQIIAEPLQLHRPQLSAAERAHEVARMLERVGLVAESASRFPHELSGGQAQRVGIARAMILRPRLLVCDEPVSALDAGIQRQILELLDELRREEGMAILLVSHNLAVIEQLCARVLVLYLGRPMEAAPGGALFRRPLHPYTRALLAAVPLPDPQQQPARLARALSGEPPAPRAAPGGCVFHTRCPHVLPRCVREAPAWEAAGPGRLVACHRWRELDQLPPPT